MKGIAVTNCDKLRDLLLTNTVGDAPTSRAHVGTWKEVILGIGKDHVAYITMTEDAHQALFGDVVSTEWPTI